MESMYLSCMLVFAGLVAVVNAQCITTNLLFRVNANTASSTVIALNDVTLTCSPGLVIISTREYSWHRVDGDLPSSSTGQNTNRLTLHNVVPADEGQYYCMATSFGHCAVSNNVTVTVEVVMARDHGNLRLVGGSNYRTGIVEIFIEPNNTWGIVCDDSWDDVDARVVCRQLGFGNTGDAIPTYPSPVSLNTPIWLDDVNCDGHESRLIDCAHNGLENHNCAHNEDAGVTCTGSFPKLPIRLVNGNTAGEGRVEIFHNNLWATVCDDDWDDTDAGVVCRQLGLSSSGLAVSFAGFGQGTDFILLDNVSCITNISNIFECRHNGFENHDCSHSKDAGVKCGDVPNNIVRLVGGSSYNEGRVEVKYNGQWGTVCDDGWDDTDAGVVCRQLGFGSSGVAANFGQGSGSIWLDNVMCTGNESTLVSCGHLGVGINRNCRHSEDAGVRCSGTQACSVQGQIRNDCAPPPQCAVTCTNRFTPIPCPAICVAGGCECPTGSVIDEDLNRCVPINECSEILCSIKGQIHTVDCFGTNATCSSPNPPMICDLPQCVCPRGQVIDEASNACINGTECRRGCDIRRISGRANYNNNRRRLTLRFSANRQGRDAFFQCRIDNQQFRACTSPMVWRNLNLNHGRHSVAVRGSCIYNGGVTSTNSRMHSFRVRN